MKYWKKLGQTLSGETALGIGLAMNSTGNIIACGQSVGGNNPIKIFEFNSSTNKWKQLGNSISISDTADNNYLGTGWYVDLSEDGYTLVTVTNNTYFQVYEYNEESETWKQKGFNIYVDEINENSNKLYNSSVSISNDGNIIAVGSTQFYEDEDEDGEDSRYESEGLVRVFKYRQYTDDDNNKYHHTSHRNTDEQTKPLIMTESTNTEPVVGKEYWTQIGQHLSAEDNHPDWVDNFGYRLSLSKDGTTLVIGARYGERIDDDDGDNNRGYVKVFYYKSDEDNWEQKGSTIYGDNQGDSAGVGVALNENGSILAISHPRTAWKPLYNKGYVKVFEYNDNEWKQLGQTIDEDALYNNDYGWNIDLSSDGLTIIVGAYFWKDYFGNSSTDLGRTHEPTQVFEFDSTSSKWKQKGQDLFGSTHYTGHNVKINSDGSRIVIGSHNRNITKVYEYTNDPHFEFKMRTVLARYPNNSLKIRRNIIEYVLLMWDFFYKN